MSRNPSTAKKAGSEFEQRVADYLATVLGDDRIERRAKHGSKDVGDIAGVRIPEGKVVIECKNYLQPQVWMPLREAEAERMNDKAAIGVAVVKVPCIGWAHMGLQCAAVRKEDFDRLFYGERAFPVGAFHCSKMRDLMLCGPRYSEVTSRKDGPRAVLMTLRTFAAWVIGGEEYLCEEEVIGDKKEESE